MSEPRRLPLNQMTLDEGCYPCSVYAYPCVQEEHDVSPVVCSAPLTSVQPGRCCFDVALWRAWPSLAPDVVGYVNAPTAFAAVECLMRFSGVVFVAVACARALDGSLVYHAYRVRVWSQEEEYNV